MNAVAPFLFSCVLVMAGAALDRSRAERAEALPIAGGSPLLLVDAVHSGAPRAAFEDSCVEILARRGVAAMPAHPWVHDHVRRSATLSSVAAVHGCARIVVVEAVDFEVGHGGVVTPAPWTMAEAASAKGHASIRARAGGHSAAAATMRIEVFPVGDPAARRRIDWRLSRANFELPDQQGGELAVRLLQPGGLPAVPAGH